MNYSKPLIVTLHGFLAFPWTMNYYKRHFNKCNLQTINWKYSSRSKNIAAHTEDFVNFLQEQVKLQPERPIYFLTHSLGGIILRAALNHPACPTIAKTGKAVLLTPPNQGCSFARSIRKYFIVRWFVRDQVGQELTTEKNFEHLGSFPTTLDLLIIAGDFSLNPLIKEKNDGLLTLEETFLSTPYQHIQLPVGHVGVLFNQKALDSTENFFLSRAKKKTGG